MVYKQSQLESFVNGFCKVDERIKSINHDFIMAPLMGAIPFIDTLAIINKNLNLNEVEYPPSTSRFENLGELLTDWYSNFLKENYIEGEKLKLIFIDEVVSGASAIRDHKYINKALEKIAESKIKELYIESKREDKSRLHDYKKILTNLKRNIIYEIIGIEDSSGKEKRNENKYYNRLKKEKIIVPIEVQKIITMDNPAYSPAQLKFSHRNKYSRPFYLPEIEGFNITPEYIGFLRDVARYVGVNPDDVNSVNQSKIFNFTKYLSDKFKTQ